MNRLIKFKIWDTKDKKMYHDVLCDIGEHDNFLDDVSCWDVCHDASNSDDVKRFIWLQFTGLKSSDEGGMPIKEAYFGDIIRFYNTEGHEKQAELIWYELEHCIGFKRLEDGFVYTQRMFNDSGYFQPSKIKFEIIGNIYQNPELIK